MYSQVAKSLVGGFNVCKNISNTKTENLKVLQRRGILEFFECSEEAKIVLTFHFTYFNSRILNIRGHAD